MLESIADAKIPLRGLPTNSLIILKCNCEVHFPHSLSKGDKSQKILLEEFREKTLC